MGAFVRQLNAQRRAQIILVVFALVGAWTAYAASKPNIVERSGRLPHLVLNERISGPIPLSAGPEGTLVIVFRTTCSACKDELTILDAASSRLAGMRIVMLTPESMAAVDSFARLFPQLSSAPARVQWGTVPIKALDAAFGRTPTPGIFAFAANGHVRARYVGSQELDTLLHVMQRQ
jgi:hypothetical protein